MAPPKWFWILLSTCIIGITCTYCWNVWYENIVRAQAQQQVQPQSRTQKVKDTVENLDQEMEEGCRQYLGLD